MSEYILLIKILLKSKYFNQYYKYIDTDFIKKNISRELYKIYYSLESLHKLSTGVDFTLEDLKLHYLSLYPPNFDELTGTLFERIEGSEPNETLGVEYLNSLKKYQTALRVIDKAQAVVDGRGELEGVKEVLSSSTGEVNASQRVLGLSVLEEETPSYGPGIKWPLECLNKAIGPLRKGNFGIVFARPETGKTTFIAQCVSHWATQTEGQILLFNNEQPNREVELRIVQSLFGVTSKQLLSNAKDYFSKFIEATKNKITVVDAVSLSYREIESWLEEVIPSVIVFDQIDKVLGFKDDRKDLEYKAIYQWAREKSKIYGPTIGICQAGSTGEGKRYLEMDDIDSSKTAKQGEADWILGIGCERGSSRETVRGLSICKNKLPGDENTIPTYRHGRFDVIIDSEKGQYYDV